MGGAATLWRPGKQAWRGRPAAAAAAAQAAQAALPRATTNNDRVGVDGILRPGGLSTQSDATRSTYVIGSPLAGDPAPPAPPLTSTHLEQLAEMLQAGRGGAVVLTGAGCSTESSIPDYRSPNGAYSTGFKPMTHQAFMASPANRARYWARSFAGWPRFSAVRHNAAHEGIARLQRLGWAPHVITQNVDRLHQAAGSPAVLELHGTTHEVMCMSCAHVAPREEVQRRMADLNPEAAEAAAGGAGGDRERALRAGTAEPAAAGRSERAPPRVQRPDGDVELDAAAGLQFQVPPCSRCGGVLKPDVVFFGDSLPPERARRAMELAASARALLVVGSSLAVWSAYRLVKAAKEGGARVAIVNVGPTRADELADLRVPARAGEAMMRLATHPALLVPPLGGG
jgi:NAD-dependent deacetylase sirtuin 4